MNGSSVPLKALLINCTLTPSPGESSTEKLAGEVAKALEKQGVSCSMIRAVDLNLKPGVEADMGEDDEWSDVRRQMLDADIFILATPTWMGHMSSVAQRVLERLDAELSYKDDEGRLETYGKVAGAVVVGNEDGAHKISADVFQALNDVGFSLAPGAVTYWNGEAMHTVDYKDLESTPDAVASTIASLAVNAVHLARPLEQQTYPPAS